MCFPSLMIEIMIFHGANLCNRTQVPEFFYSYICVTIEGCQRWLSSLKVRKESGQKEVKGKQHACVILEMLS